jgi:hypothetical protein
MKKHAFLTIPLMLISALIVIVGCEKEDNSRNLPTLETTVIFRISSTTAYSGGHFTSEGNSSVEQKGVCWSASPTPTTSISKTVDGPQAGTYTSMITGLTPNTKYYVRAYAINSSGISYGNEYSFTTLRNDSAPCTPQSNSIWFSSQHQTFSTTAGENGLVNGEYGLVGNGMYSDLRIVFPSAPATGKYVTITGSSFIEEGQCVVSGGFGGSFSEYYEAHPGDTVYVIKNGEGKYSMSFCNLTFQSTSFTFSSDGNLTTE